MYSHPIPSKRKSAPSRFSFWNVGAAAHRLIRYEGIIFFSQLPWHFKRWYRSQNNFTVASPARNQEQNFSLHKYLNGFDLHIVETLKKSFINSKRESLTIQSATNAQKSRQICGAIKVQTMIPWVEKDDPTRCNDGMAEYPIPYLIFDTNGRFPISDTSGRLLILDAGNLFTFLDSYGRFFILDASGRF